MRALSYAFVLAALTAAGSLLWTHIPGNAQQQPSPSRDSWPQSQANFPQPVVAGGGWGWGGTHASTAEQGMMEGMSSMMQAAGAEFDERPGGGLCGRRPAQEHRQPHVRHRRLFPNAEDQPRSAGGGTRASAVAGRSAAVCPPTGAEPSQSQRTGSADGSHFVAQPAPRGRVRGVPRPTGVAVSETGSGWLLDRLRSGPRCNRPSTRCKRISRRISAITPLRSTSRRRSLLRA